MKICTGVCTPAQLLEFSRKVAFGEDGPSWRFSGFFASNRSECARRCLILSFSCSDSGKHSFVEATVEHEYGTPHGFEYSFYMMENVHLVFWKDQKSNQVTASKVSDDCFVITVFVKNEDPSYFEFLHQLSVRLTQVS